ncbi:TPA: PD-(D/E)XK nuclease family protein [Kluyvera georgiana]
MDILTDAFFQQLDALKPEEAKEHNFFSIGGAGYFENPTSSLLALFMGMHEDIPPWLLKALMVCLKVEADIEQLDVTSLTVSREARTTEGNFLDIVVYHQDFIIGIEHKTISAINNPFCSYERHLQNLADNSQTIYRCILAPDALPCKPVERWPLLRYSQLLSSARNRLGHELAGLPLSKWHIFYTEFLNHLHTLSGADSTMTMNHENQTFVDEHFVQLLRAKNLLNDFESAMVEEAKNTLLTLLPDTHIAHSINNWRYDYKAIHLYPECWGSTYLSLVYYPDKRTGRIRYYLNGRINVRDHADLPCVHQWLIDNALQPTFLPSANKADREIKLNGKELLISFGTPDGTLDSAKRLMAEIVDFISTTLKQK